jgi:hypothetical protein
LRRRGAAQGIHDFQAIAGSALTESYLKLKGIEATKELAASKNSKIVLFGNRSSGLPLLLDDKDAPSDATVKTDSAAPPTQDAVPPAPPAPSPPPAAAAVDPKAATAPPPPPPPAAKADVAPTTRPAPAGTP